MSKPTYKELRRAIRELQSRTGRSPSAHVVAAVEALRRERRMTLRKWVRPASELICMGDGSTDIRRPEPPFGDA